ncbi:MAG: sporulation integral membrane protein YtvI [Lachnospiraceae bacterium]|nr:sporulation integral membrane protein YtvI [Lachnospiraceae bacterium]
MKKSTKYLKIAVNIIGMAALAVFFFVLLPRILIYFMPFVVAGLIALIANPLVRFMEKKVKITRKAGTAMVIIIVIALVVTVLYFVIWNLVVQFIGFLRLAPEIWESTNDTIRDFLVMLRGYMSRFPIPVREWSDTVLDSFSNNMTDWISGIGSSIAQGGFTEETGSNVGLTLVSIIMGIIASYFFLADKDYLVGFADKYIPESLVKRWELVYSTVKYAVGGYFIAQFKIMGVIYIELFIGLLILGVKFSFLIAFLIALLDFLPFFGTGAVMWPWAIVKLLQQDYKMAAGLFIIWIIGQAIRQMIQPKLVGDSIGLDPIPTLFLLYIGFRLGGPFGLILAIPIGMVIINLYRAGVFSNFKYSCMMLLQGIEKVRRFTPEELAAEGVQTEPVSDKRQEESEKKA